MATNQVVVVTGASAGVGRAAVRAFAASGASIGLLARGRDGLEGARREVKAAGGRALALPTDVANADQVEQAAEEIERKLGAIDVWVNNAMVSVFSPVSEMEAEEYQRVTDVTYLGTVHGTLAALRRMRRRGRGVIVQVGSALAYRSIPRAQQHKGHGRALAGVEHAAVRLGTVAAATQATTGTADLSAGGRGTGDRLCRPAPSP
jgi:NADP-dependent 3-hydroxy acid dehydrogenase YdfG